MVVGGPASINLIVELNMYTCYFIDTVCPFILIVIIILQ